MKVCEFEVVVCVVKNRFVKIVFEGKFCESMGEYLMGMIVLIYFEDFVVVVKVVEDFVKENLKFEIFGGVMGENVLDCVGVEVVFKMFFCEEFIVFIVGCIGVFVFNIVGVIGVFVSNIVFILFIIEEKVEVV